MKKIFAVLLILIMLNTSMVYAEPSEPSYFMGHWAEYQLKDWVNRGLIPEDVKIAEYDPDQKITRYELVSLINRLYQFSETTQQLEFKDISKESNPLVYEEIIKAVNAGYIEGFEDGEFKPEENITRQEIAMIISKVEKLEPVADSEILKSFTDADEIPEKSKGYIGAVVEKGYMKGTSDNSFNALDTISRAEVISILDRVATKSITATEAKPLFDALKKQQELKEVESKSTISLNFNASGLPQNEQEAIDAISNIINSLKFEVDSKAITNDDASKVVAEAKINAIADGMGIGMTVWVDMDMSGDTQKFIEIIQIPQLIGSFLPEEFQGKSYIVMDLLKPEGSTNIIDMKFIENAKKLQGHTMKILENIIDDPANNLGDVIKNRGIKIIETPEGKEEAMIYQIKLDDRDFKVLLRNLINEMAKDEVLIDFIKDYINMMKQFDTKEENRAIYEDSIKSIDNDMDVFLVYFNIIMDAFDKVTLIGDRGIVTDYVVNNEGYVVNTKGNADIVLNLGEIKRAFAGISGNAESDEIDAREFCIYISFDTDLTNINGDIKIELPEITEENSLTIDAMNEAISK